MNPPVTRIQLFCPGCREFFSGKKSDVERGRTCCSRECSDSFKIRPLIDRLFAMVDKTEECWNWTGGVAKSGYGSINRGRRTEGTVLVHRASWELLRGPIPDGLHIDHLCRNRRCVNPDHLEPVSPGENVLRGEGLSAQNARKTRCKRGHSLDDALIINGARFCRECNRLRAAAFRATGHATLPEVLPC
jgi:hypothetical protein